MKYYTSTTEFNCGIDLHARQMYVCVMDRKGKKLVHTNVKDNDFNFFLKLIEPYKHDITATTKVLRAGACAPALWSSPAEHSGDGALAQSNSQSKWPSIAQSQSGVVALLCPRTP